MELNYFGAIALILGFLPAMRQNQSGHIINILTMGVQFRTPQYSAYIASKSALDAASRCIAAEVQNQGVFFSQVYMPLVKTPMISPTKVYENEESWTPEEAANFILNAMVTKKPAISPTLGKIAEIFHTFIPNSAFVVMNRYFRKRKKQEKTIKVAENEGSS